MVSFTDLVVLLQTLLPIFQTLKPALKTWVLDVLIENALSRAPLSPEHKTTREMLFLIGRKYRELNG